MDGPKVNIIPIRVVINIPRKEVWLKGTPNSVKLSVSSSKYFSAKYLALSPLP